MRSTTLWRWVQDDQKESGLREQRAAGHHPWLYFLDAHAPHEHEVPGHEGGTKPLGWTRCAGCAVGGEEGTV